MTFNVSKCKIMHFGPGNSRQRISMADSNGRTYLEETSLEKDLGIWFDDSLKFHEHVMKAAEKANQILGLIRRTFTYMDCQLMKQLFTSLVRPHLEYGNVVWHPNSKRDIEILERVQHRATRMVPGLAKLSYEDRLRKMDLPSLVYRRVRGDVIEVYKYLHGVYKVGCTQLLPLHESASMKTRGNSLKLKKGNVNVSCVRITLD
jgi:hypothetical protein